VAQMRDVVGEALGQLRAADELQEGALRIGVRKHQAARYLLATLQAHACSAPALDQDLRDRRLGPECDARRAARRRDRVRDGAHAAFRQPPAAALALELAERVLEEGDSGA